MDLPITTKTCRMCEQPVTAEARFCSTCGFQLDGTAPGPKRASKWHHNIWMVLFLLFFVLGPFGLPLVWTNPRFSRTVKWLLTGLMGVYMWTLIVLMTRMVAAVSNQLEQLNNTYLF